MELLNHNLRLGKETYSGKQKIDIKWFLYHIDTRSCNNAKSNQFDSFHRRDLHYIFYFAKYSKHKIRLK